MASSSSVCVCVCLSQCIFVSVWVREVGRKSQWYRYSCFSVGSSRTPLHPVEALRGRPSRHSSPAPVQGSPHSAGSSHASARSRRLAKESPLYQCTFLQLYVTSRRFHPYIAYLYVTQCTYPPINDLPWVFFTLSACLPTVHALCMHRVPPLDAVKFHCLSVVLLLTSLYCSWPFRVSQWSTL